MISRFNNYSYSKIPFQKKLVANCTVIKDNSAYPCSIYSLSAEEDKNYFKNLEYEKDWIDGDYLSHADYLISKKAGQREFYTIEDKDENCLGFCCTDLIDKNANRVEVIETVNRAISGNSKSRYKYIGETLLSFLCKLTDKDTKKQELQIDSPMSTALDFYVKKCGFKFIKTEYETRLALQKEDFSTLTKQNENHTKGKIELVA